MLKKIFVILFLVAVYFFILDVTLNYHFPSKTIQNIEFQEQGTKVNMGLHDSVSVSTKKPRWYGTWFESGDGKSLKAFGFADIPLKSKGTDLLLIHGLMGFLILFIALKGGKDEKLGKNSLDNRGDVPIWNRD